MSRSIGSNLGSKPGICKSEVTGSSPVRSIEERESVSMPLTPDSLEQDPSAGAVEATRGVAATLRALLDPTQLHAHRLNVCALRTIRLRVAQSLVSVVRRRRAAALL